MAAIFEMRGFGPAKAFLTAAQEHRAPSQTWIPPRRDLEGYLFPATYALSRTATAEQLVAMMVERFRSVWAEVSEGRDLEGMTVRQVMALASLVEKETAAPEERPLVAAVYRNRLARRMGLQADPTVVYALSKAGRYTGNIRKVDLDINSPYNTYRFPGLPPGPIAAPGRAAIEAALAPADVPYLYFVSRNDGTHVFAETLTRAQRERAEVSGRVLRSGRGSRERQPAAARAVKAKAKAKADGTQACSRLPDLRASQVAERLRQPFPPVATSRAAARSSCGSGDFTSLQRAVRAADPHEVAWAQRVARLAVVGDEDLVGAGGHVRPHLDHLVARDHDRPVGQRVRGDRRQHHRVHPRVHDRAAGRQVVGGGPGGSSPRSTRRP